MVLINHQEYTPTASNPQKPRVIPIPSPNLFHHLKTVASLSIRRKRFIPKIVASPNYNLFINPYLTLDI
jgi:hypothetical protein